ncbi:hypothetical protein HUK80_07170 [Flavobacterium sp. MAH-1]|uniref:NIPSNAP protein n=1 Tax=Flavobacterium agri TaxID=2743471 RepID=A0A7Y8Y167_9FLAO|nr:hypothetical protein [Flavobacterium agri]NUY80670.1 hypothetical protein [Flavobacterium agri]NYA70694.1 hypothetical protein [Flavobacterium agri]
MKTIKTILSMLLLALPTWPAIAQEFKEQFVTSTKMHRNVTGENLTRAEWLSLEKEYFDKVISKNEFIVGHRVLMHYFTPDNTEFLVQSTYDSWEAIEKANTRTDDLVKKGWPDEKARKTFFEKRWKYYQPQHSDEIYSTMAGGRMPKAKSDKPQIFYMRVNYWGTPKDGTQKEFDELNKQFVEAVFYKNDLIKGYMPLVHAWGADNMQYTEIFVVDAMCDLEKAIDKNDELFKAKWDTEAKRKEFETKFDKYFDGRHGDFIFQSVPELAK